MQLQVFVYAVIQKKIVPTWNCSQQGQWIILSICVMISGRARGSLYWRDKTKSSWCTAPQLKDKYVLDFVVSCLFNRTLAGAQSAHWQLTFLDCSCWFWKTLTNKEWAQSVPNAHPTTIWLKKQRMVEMWSLGRIMQQEWLKKMISFIVLATKTWRQLKAAWIWADHRRQLWSLSDLLVMESTLNWAFTTHTYVT